MAYRKIEQAMTKGKKWAEEQLKAGIPIAPEMAEKAAANAFQHRGHQYLFITAAMEVLLEKEKTFAKSA